MDYKKVLSDYWDDVHTSNNIRCLTGNNFKQHISILEINEGLCSAGRVVLNIGVGLGEFSRTLVQRGCDVYDVDISQVALDRTKDSVCGQFLAYNLDQLPDDFFNLATSVLVSQHMPDEDLIYQFKHVIRSLKEDGIFAVQFAGSDIERSNNNPNNYSGDEPKAQYCRTIDYVENIVKDCGGVIVYSNKNGKFPEHTSYCYVVHIKRQE
jgi:SAM-dependent methyltransferase